MADTLAVVALNLAEAAQHVAIRALDRAGISIDTWLDNLGIGYMPSPLCILCDQFAEDGDICERCQTIIRNSMAGGER